MVLGNPASLELIRITADYSNAVLVAVLPFISNFAEKLELPVSHPISIEQVVSCRVAPNNRVEASIFIKGGWHFVFRWGYVQTMETSNSYHSLQESDRIPNLFGPLRMSKLEAVEMARETLKKLGIPLESVYAEEDPEISGPFAPIGTNVVPYYYLVWPDPKGGSSVEIEINGNAKRVERIELRNRGLERAPPSVAIVPERDPNQPSWPKVNPEYARQLVPIVLKAVQDYGRLLSLPVPSPLTTNQVARFVLEDNLGRPHCEVELTNGWRFIYRDTMVNGFYAPDNLFNNDKKPPLIKDIRGEWNISETEAKQLVSRNISKLNYPTNLVHFEVKSQVSKPSVSGIPRYIFFWYYHQNEDDDLQSTIWAEVDADKKQLKSLYYEDKAFWGKRPPIDVPLSFPSTTSTNEPQKTNPRRTPRAAPNRPFVPMDTNIR